MLANGTVAFWKLELEVERKSSGQFVGYMIDRQFEGIFKPENSETSNQLYQYLNEGFFISMIVQSTKKSSILSITHSTVFSPAHSISV